MTERQAKFLAYYLGPEAYRNASRAARLAGYAWPDRQGPTLARHPAFASQIRAHLAGADAPPPRIDRTHP